MNNVALGQYMPLDSVVHKMDPRSKIMIMLFLMVAIFIPAGVLGYVIIGIFILLSLYLSKLNIKYALKQEHLCFQSRDLQSIVMP